MSKHNKKWVRQLKKIIESEGAKVENLDQTKHLHFTIRFSNGMLKQIWFGSTVRRIHPNQIRRQIQAVKRGEKPTK
jgi:hypothetical protein